MFSYIGTNEIPVKEDKVDISPRSSVGLSVWFWNPRDTDLDALTHHWEQNTSSLICWEELEMAELEKLNNSMDEFTRIKFTCLNIKIIL